MGRADPRVLRFAVRLRLVAVLLLVAALAGCAAAPPGGGRSRSNAAQGTLVDERNARSSTGHKMPATVPEPDPPATPGTSFLPWLLWGTYIPAIFWIAGAACGVLLLYSLHLHRLQNVHLVLLLKNGSRYALELNDLLAHTDLREPRDRCRSLRRIALLVQTEDVEDAFLVARQYWFGSARAARRDAAAGRRIAGVCAGLPPKAESRRRRRPPAHCVLGVTFSYPVAEDLTYARDGGPDRVREVLKELRHFEATADALHLYYAPPAGEPLEGERARELFRNLRDAFVSPSGKQSASSVPAVES